MNTQFGYLSDFVGQVATIICLSVENVQPSNHVLYIFLT